MSPLTRAKEVSARLPSEPPPAIPGPARIRAAAPRLRAPDAYGSRCDFAPFQTYGSRCDFAPFHTYGSRCDSAPPILDIVASARDGRDRVAWTRALSGTGRRGASRHPSVRITVPSTAVAACGGRDPQPGPYVVRVETRTFCRARARTGSPGRADASDLGAPHAAHPPAGGCGPPPPPGVLIPANGAPSCATVGRRDGGAVESNAPGSAGCRRGAVAAAAPLLVEAKARRRRR